MGLERSQRRRSWDMLRQLAEIGNYAWCVIGDFNNIRKQSEKIGGHSQQRWVLEGFNNAIRDCGFDDFPMGKG